jgi:trk system potassium uptake protein TrkH
MCVVCILLLLSCGLGGVEALTGAMASLGNVGPGLGELGSFGNYGGIPALAKFVCSLAMILGRLEIYPLLIVILMMFKRIK